MVLEVAKSLRDELRKEGIEVILTRSYDVFIPLARRAAIANKKAADLFVSIHANASLTTSLKGFEVYYLSEATDDTALALERAENSVLHLESAEWDAPSKDLKAIVWDMKEAENRKESLKLSRWITDSVENFAGVSTHRIKAAQFYVLKWAECPAVLVELGYLTHPLEEKKLNNPLYKQELVRGIAKGLLEYKAEFEKTDGFTKE